MRSRSDLGLILTLDVVDFVPWSMAPKLRLTGAIWAACCKTKRKNETKNETKSKRNEKRNENGTKKETKTKQEQKIERNGDWTKIKWDGPGGYGG